MSGDIARNQPPWDAFPAAFHSYVHGSLAENLFSAYIARPNVLDDRSLHGRCADHGFLTLWLPKRKSGWVNGFSSGVFAPDRLTGHITIEEKLVCKILVPTQNEVYTLYNLH